MPAAHPVDLEKLTPILKAVYLPFRKKAFPMLTVLLAQIKRAGPETVTYAGEDLFFAVKLDRRGGFVASQAGYFPHSKIAREKKGRLGITRSYIRVQVDGLTVRASADSKGSYLSAAKKIVEDAQEQWKLEQNRIAYGDGRAIRAVVQAKSSDTEYILHNPYGITDAGPGNLHLVTGEDIAIIDSVDFTCHGKAQIANIALNGDLATVTLNGPIPGGAVGDFFVTAVPAAVHPTDSSFGAEPYGVEAICDPAGNFATFEGINDPRWAAYNTAAADIDEPTLMSFLNVIRARSGVDWRQNPSAMLLITTTGIWQAYGETLLGLRRFNAPQMNLKGGFIGVQVGNATLVDDPWCPRGRLYAIHTPDLIFVDLMDWGMLSHQDAPKWRPGENQDIWSAVFGAYWNIGALMRNSHGCITGIPDATNYSPVY